MGTCKACPSHFQHIQGCIVIESFFLTMLMDKVTRNLYPSKYSIVVTVMFHMIMVKQGVFASTSKVWDIHTQILIVGYHWKIETLSMVCILAKQLSPMHVLSYIWNKYSLPCKQVICYKFERRKRSWKSLGKIPTHPPLHCNEEEFGKVGL
jgi:hypothetical protein